MFQYLLHLRFKIIDELFRYLQARIMFCHLSCSILRSSLMVIAYKYINISDTLLIDPKTYSLTLFYIW